MTLIQNIQSQAGSLIMIKSKLYWRKPIDVWDKNTEILCILLDAMSIKSGQDIDNNGVKISATAYGVLNGYENMTILQLLIYDSIHWVLLNNSDFEIVK